LLIFSLKLNCFILILLTIVIHFIIISLINLFLLINNLFTLSSIYLNIDALLITSVTHLSVDHIIVLILINLIHSLFGEAISGNSSISEIVTMTPTQMLTSAYIASIHMIFNNLSYLIRLIIAYFELIIVLLLTSMTHTISSMSYSLYLNILMVLLKNIFMNIYLFTHIYYSMDIYLLNHIYLFPHIYW